MMLHHQQQLIVKVVRDNIGISSNGRQTSPSGSVSSANDDSGCSVSPASPSSLHVKKDN